MTDLSLADAPSRDLEQEAAARSGVRHRLLRDARAWLGGSIVAIVVLLALVGPWISPHDPAVAYRDLMPLDGTALPPGGDFLLGTDVAGHDLLSRLIAAARPTLIVGVGANLAALAVGCLVGLAAVVVPVVRVRLGRGPRSRSVGVPVGSALMGLADLALAFPPLLLALAFAAVVTPSLATVILVVGLVLWIPTARIVRARASVVAASGFVQAAEAVGATPVSILRRHQLPHLAAPLAIQAAVGVGVALLLEASLSYLGAGAPVSTYTWGTLLVDGAEWWTADPRLPLLPGAAIAVTVLGFLLLGDALQDALDPRRAARTGGVSR